MRHSSFDINALGLALSTAAACLLLSPSMARSQEAITDAATSPSVGFKFSIVTLTGKTERKEIYGDSKQYFTEPRSSGGSNFPNPFDIFAPSSIANALLNGAFNGTKQFEVETFNRVEIPAAAASQAQVQCAEIQKANFMQSLSALAPNGNAQLLTNKYASAVIIEDRTALSGWSPSREYRSYAKTLMAKEKVSREKAKNLSAYYQSTSSERYSLSDLITRPSIQVGGPSYSYEVRLKGYVAPNAKTKAPECHFVDAKTLAEFWTILDGFNPSYSLDTIYESQTN